MTRGCCVVVSDEKGTENINPYDKIYDSQNNPIHDLQLFVLFLHLSGVMFASKRVFSHIRVIMHFSYTRCFTH